MDTNYTDLISASRLQQEERKNIVRLKFALSGFKFGEISQAAVTFRIVEQTMSTTTIEVMDFKKGDQSPDHGMLQVVPAPS